MYAYPDVCLSKKIHRFIYLFCFLINNIFFQNCNDLYFSKIVMIYLFVPLSNKTIYLTKNLTDLFRFLIKNIFNQKFNRFIYLFRILIKQYI